MLVEDCMKRLVCSVLLALAMAPAVAEGHPAWGIIIDDRGRIIFSDVGMNAIWMMVIYAQPPEKV